MKNTLQNCGVMNVLEFACRFILKTAIFMLV